jgi:tetratricopeptide (TPR) repeat protein
MNGEDISAIDVEPLLLQSLTPYYNYRWRALRGVVWRDHKLVQGSTSELYALKDDPGELVDLAKRRADLVADLSRVLEKLVAEHAPLGWAVSRSVPVDELELLASLGYGTHHPGEAPFDPALPNPHERIGDIDLVNEAGANFTRWGEISTRYATAWQRDQNGRQFLEKARALVLELRERNPRDPMVPYLLGAIESELRNYEAAIPLLEQAARDRPFDSVCRARLADAYAKTQRTGDAISEMQKAIDLVPEQPLYHQRLIGYSLDARRYDNALQWMDRYVEAMKAGSAEHRDALDWVAAQQRRIPADARRSAVNSTAIQ